MKLIDKHLLREFLIPVTYCLLAFVMVLIINELFGDMSRIIENKPSVSMIVRFYISILGPSMQYLTPASLMLATLYTLYSLTRSNELVAMRASGISIYRITVPFLVVGVVFSLATAILNETWIPHAMEWAEEVRANKFNLVETKMVEQCIYVNADQHRQWVINQFDTKHPNILKDVEVKQEDEDGNREFIIIAERAEYLDDQWWFSNPTIQQFDDNDYPIGEAEPFGIIGSVVEMPDLNEHPQAFVSTMRPWAFLNIREMHLFLDTNESLAPRALSEKLYGFHSRLAMPWACFIVILFAVPAGTRTARQGMFTAIFSAVGLMAGFYALSQVGLVIGSTGLVSPWLGAWLSNIVFCGIGIAMMMRMR